MVCKKKGGGALFPRTPLGLRPKFRLHGYLSVLVNHLHLILYEEGVALSADPRLGIPNSVIALEQRAISITEDSQI